MLAMSSFPIVFVFLPDNEVYTTIFMSLGDNSLPRCVHAMSHAICKLIELSRFAVFEGRDLGQDLSVL